MVVIRSKHLEDPRRGYRNCTQHRKDPPAGGTSAGTTRAGTLIRNCLRAGNATSSQSKRNDSCIHGSMTLRAPLCWRPLRPTRALVAAAGWPVSTSQIVEWSHTEQLLIESAAVPRGTWTTTAAPLDAPVRLWL
jgi:hypothetical protein